MKTKNMLTVVAAAAFAVFTQGAFAQASSPSRADVKAETKAAEKSGKLQPAGEGKAAMSSASGPSDKTRDERKTQTKADAKSGSMQPAGESATAKDDKASKSSKSTKTKADQKAETQADVKGKKTTPAGEGVDPK